MIRSLTVRTVGTGLYDITGLVAGVVQESGLAGGLCTVFIRHTSASLVIQENADPSVRTDLQAWMNRLVPEGDPRHTHTVEGPDDMPAHIRAALTCVSLGIPIVAGGLALGTWQGIFVWEHRRAAHQRAVLVHCA